MGAQNLFILKICGTKICGYSKNRGYSNLLVFILIYYICGYSKLWVHKICDDTKFQVSGREYQNICVFCLSCEQKNICAFSIYAFCHMCKNIPCELALKTFISSICLAQMNVFKKFDEIPSMILQDIKETIRNRHTHTHAVGRTDNVKTVYPPTNTDCGGYNQALQPQKIARRMKFPI